MELLWIPAKFALDQEVHRARMVPVVFQHKLFPRKREEVRKRMRQEPELQLPLAMRCTLTYALTGQCIKMN